MVVNENLASFTAKLHIASLNAHFPHLKPQHKMLEAGFKRQTVNESIYASKRKVCLQMIWRRLNTGSM